MDQLHITLASALSEHLQFLASIPANRLTAGSETIEDIRRLCSVFEHVEKPLTVAASLHIASSYKHYDSLIAIFSDCCSFYFPRMGTSSS
ncbi:hypothetical protein EV1_028907 [Malus domestica]